MERVFKWLLPVLIAAEVVLVWSGWIDLGTAVGLVIALEVLLFLVSGRQLVTVVRRYRRDRAAGLDPQTALTDSLAVVLPRKLARLVALEPTIWYCLFLWLARRRPADAGSFSYSKRSIMGALVVVILLTAPVEILLIELLIPWAWLRWLLLAGSIYSIIWVIGLYASLVVLPHRIDPAGVDLRHGVLAHVRVRLHDISLVEYAPRKVSGGREGLTVVPDEQAAYLSTGGRTDVALVLRTPHTISALLGPTLPVTSIYVAVDEPERFVSEMRRLLERGEDDADTVAAIARQGQSISANNPAWTSMTGCLCGGVRPLQIP